MLRRGGPIDLRSGTRVRVAMLLYPPGVEPPRHEDTVNLLADFGVDLAVVATDLVVEIAAQEAVPTMTAIVAATPTPSMVPTLPPTRTPAAPAPSPPERRPTASHPDGLIRGQVQAPLRLPAVLSGDQEVPPVNSPDDGRALLVVNSERTALRLAFEARLAVSRCPNMRVHVHVAPPGRNGPIVFNLPGDPLTIPALASHGAATVRSSPGLWPRPASSAAGRL